jgi:hypothetical protein
MLDAAGEIQEHLAGVEDYILAEAVWREAIARWPDATIILRQGARVVHDIRRRISLNDRSHEWVALTLNCPAACPRTVTKRARGRNGRLRPATRSCDGQASGVATARPDWSESGFPRRTG